MTWKSARCSLRRRPSTLRRKRRWALPKAFRAITTTWLRASASRGTRRATGEPWSGRGYGLFYDHPLLAIAFDSVTADGGRSVQLISPGGTPSACGLVTAACGGGLDTPNNLNGTTIFQGALNALPNMFYQPNQQRFDPLNPNSLFANQNYLTSGFPLPILPFTLPVAKNFQYGYAQQANLTIERQIAGTWKISAGYQWTRGLHLNRPVDINSTDPVLLTNNLLNASVAGLNFTNPLSVVVPSSDINPTASTCGLYVSATQAPGVLGVLNGCPTALAAFDGKFVGTPAFFNYFRRSGPNPSFAGLVPGGYGTQVALASAAGYPTGFGVPVPFNSVDTQLSDAASWYNALTINVQKSFSRHFTMLSSYTWSHSLDNGTDLQSTLEPADSRFAYLEKSNSVNDQRHRWVTSGVYQTSPHKGGESFAQNMLSDITVAPLVELSSGRPFNIITSEDTRLDLGASEIRPSLSSRERRAPQLLLTFREWCLVRRPSASPTRSSPSRFRVSHRRLAARATWAAINSPCRISSSLICAFPRASASASVSAWT